MLSWVRKFCLEKRWCEEYETSINPEWAEKAGQRLVTVPSSTGLVAIK